MPLFFLGTREWRNRQTRTVQVRVPVMEWGFNSPLAHDETADPLRICGFCFPWLLHVAPLVFRAPEAPAVVCAGGRRPAREPSALRAFGSARRLEARPGPATAHGHRSRALRRPPHRRRCVADVWLGASPRSRPGLAAAHRHRSQALRRPPHRRRLVADVLLGALLRSQAGSRASTCSLSSVSHAIP